MLHIFLPCSDLYVKGKRRDILSSRYELLELEELSILLELELSELSDDIVLSDEVEELSEDSVELLDELPDEMKNSLLELENE